MSELSQADRRELRARAHHLDPVVSIAGNGLSTGVLKEIDRALKAHELIKIRVYGDDRAARAAYLAEICAQLGCAPVQSIGKLLIIYRRNEAPAASPSQPPSTRKPAARRKKPADEPAFNLRPGRPTTGNAPRKALSGAPAARYRKPAAGAARAKKSAR